MMLEGADSGLVERLLPSPNGRERRDDEALRMVIVHGTWMASDEEALARLRDPEAQVSCHYYIDRKGGIFQLVAEDRVAFHAGKSRWKIDGGWVEGLNGWSIGIELGNAGPFAGRVPGAAEEAHISDRQWAEAEPYGDGQYQALIALLQDILQRHPEIAPREVVGHDMVSPGRKTDPGRHFDWHRLMRAGVCVR